MPSDQTPPYRAEESLVDLRCSVLVLRDGEVLLIHRTSAPGEAESGDWVLPGGRPRAGESLAACARRETAEETGLDVVTARCLFVLEVSSPEQGERVVELVFEATSSPGQQPRTMEDHRHPKFVPMTAIRQLTLHPPLAGHVANMRRGGIVGASYLGNLWRPQELTEGRH